jgi:hypothetical protein
MPFMPHANPSRADRVWDVVRVIVTFLLVVALLWAPGQLNEINTKQAERDRLKAQADTIAFDRIVRDIRQEIRDAKVEQVETIKARYKEQEKLRKAQFNDQLVKIGGWADQVIDSIKEDHESAERSRQEVREAVRLMEERIGQMKASGDRIMPPAVVLPLPPVRRLPQPAPNPGDSQDDSDKTP